MAIGGSITETTQAKGAVDAVHHHADQPFRSAAQQKQLSESVAEPEQAAAQQLGG